MEVVKCWLLLIHPTPRRHFALLLWPGRAGGAGLDPQIHSLTPDFPSFGPVALRSLPPFFFANTATTQAERRVEYQARYLGYYIHNHWQKQR